MNSKLNVLNLQTASLMVAMSLNFTAQSALAESSSSSQASSQASGQASSQTAYQQTAKAPSYASGTKVEKTTTNTQPAPATTVKTPDLVALQGPTLVTQKGSGWKTLTTYLDLKNGQEALPLTFTVTNGANGQAKMQGIRIKLNSHEVLTEKAFKDRDTVSISLSDVATYGQPQLIFETYGPVGATLSWVVTTLKIKVSEIKPVNCKIGDIVKISGKNFPIDKSAYRLTVDQTVAEIKKATAAGIEFAVPTGVAAGKRTVTLYIAGVKCDPLYIKIAAAPEVTGCNLLGAAPGGEVKIQGKGFSTIASENQILLKSLDGNLISTMSPTAASETELTATIPMDFPCPSETLCTVKTSGQESTKGVTFSVGLRVIDKGLLQ